MTTSRLLSGFRLTSTTRSVRFTCGGVANTLTLQYGYPYRWTCNDETGAVNGYRDFADELRDAMTVAWGGGHTWNVKVIGVDASSTTQAEGRIKIWDSLNPALVIVANLTHAAWTLDPRVLGWRDKTADKTSVAGILVSDCVHRYGWYPQSYVVTEVPQPERDGSQVVTSDCATDIVSWGEYEITQVSWEYIGCPLVRGRAAQLGFMSADYLLDTSGDPNCGLDVFIGDLAFGRSEDWRLYLTCTDQTVFIGDYVLPRNSPLTTRPLSLSSMMEEAPELWACAIEGIRVMP